MPLALLVPYFDPNPEKAGFLNMKH